jgi:hypothetical protein
METQTARETVLEPVLQTENVIETAVQSAPLPLIETVKNEIVPLEKTLIQPVYNTIDTLFNKVILNSSLLTTIHDLKTNGFNNASIPLLILSITNAYNSYTTSIRARKLTVDDMQVLIERVYNYLVDKYDLIAVPDRLAMYNLFDLSLKLCLATPNVKKEVNSCLNFFNCGK